MHPSVLVSIAPNSCILSLRDGYPTTNHVGTSVALLRSAIRDCLVPYKVNISLVGVGFKAFLSESCIIISLGYSHFIAVAIPSDIKIFVKDNKIEILGACNVVTMFAAKLKSLKKYNPYKGKGVIIDGQYMRRKEGKKNK